MQHGTDRPTDSTRHSDRRLAQYMRNLVLLPLYLRMYAPGVFESTVANGERFLEFLRGKQAGTSLSEQIFKLTRFVHKVMESDASKCFGGYGLNEFQSAWNGLWVRNFLKYDRCMPCFGILLGLQDLWCWEEFCGFRKIGLVARLECVCRTEVAIGHDRVLGLLKFWFSSDGLDRIFFMSRIRCADSSRSQDFLQGFIT